MKNKIRILFIGTSHSLIFKRWVEWFIDNESFEVGVIGKVENEFGIDNFYDIAVPKWNKYQKTYLLGYFIQLFKIKKAIKKFKPDVVHSHQSFLYGIFISLLNFHPHVLTLWGSDVLLCPKQSKIILYLTIFALKRADAITAESKYILDECKKYRIKEEKLHQIQFGVDVSIFKDIENIKLDFPLDEKRDIVIFARGLEEIYNPMLLVEAMPSVIKENSNVLFVFKYFNRKGNNINLSEIRNKIIELGIEDKYYMFIDELPYNKLIKLYSAAKIFISIPASDSISISLIEAMVVGCVPIVSDIPANRELVDGRNGVIVKFDSNELAQEIVNVFSNYVLFKKHIIQNKQTFLERFDLHNNMDKISKIYSNL